MTEKQFPKYDQNCELKAMPCIICGKVVYCYCASEAEVKDTVIVCDSQKPSCVKKFQELVAPKIEVVGLEKVEPKPKKGANKMYDSNRFKGNDDEHSPAINPAS